MHDVVVAVVRRAPPAGIPTHTAAVAVVDVAIIVHVVRNVVAGPRRARAAFIWTMISPAGIPSINQLTIQGTIRL